MKKLSWEEIINMEPFSLFYLECQNTTLNEKYFIFIDGHPIQNGVRSIEVYNVSTNCFDTIYVSNSTGAIFYA